MKQLIQLLFSLMVLSLFISGCGNSDSKSGKPKVLVFARGSDSQKLDPADVDDGESVKALNQMFEGLLRFKPGTLEIEPWLAESYSVSQDGLTMTFNIREGISFHDGTSLTAEAAAYSFRRQMDVTHPGHLEGSHFEYWKSLYSDIIEVNTRGAMVLEFKLSQPNSTLVYSMAAFPAYLISPKSIEDYGEEIRRHPVGTGPYEFVSWELDQAMVMKRFENYWTEKAGFDRLILKTVPDNTVRLLELTTGKIHGLDGLQPAEMNSLKNDERFTVYHEAGMNFAYLAFNASAERLREPEIREAIYMAIDRDKIVQLALDGMGESAHFPMAKGMLGEPTEFDPVAFNPEKAKAILSQYSDRWDTPIVISVMNAPRQYAPDPVKMMSLVKEDLKNVGLEVEIEVRDFRNHLHHTRNARHEMGFLGWMGDNGDPDNFLSIHLGSWAATLGSATNIAFYKNDLVDEKLIAARQTSDLAERQLLYEELLAQWRKDLPYLPLVHGETIIALKSDLADFTLAKTGDLYLGSVKAGE